MASKLFQFFWQQLTPKPHFSEQEIQAKINEIAARKDKPSGNIRDVAIKELYDDWNDAQERLSDLSWDRFLQWLGIRDKKGWDWVQLLIMPIVLAALTLLFSYCNNQEQQKIAQANRDQDRKIADDKQKDEILKNYINSMKGLLLDEKHPLRSSKEGSESNSIARTLTLTVLRQLDDDRNKLVTQFLQDSHLIVSENRNQGILSLHDAYLSNAKLGGTKLGGADLHRANLSNADLSNADLSNANLSNANLSNANLDNANLDGTDLNNAMLSKAQLKGTVLTSTHNLSKAQLDDAKLNNAKLNNANLRGVYLSGANLSGASLNDADFSEADLRDANLRDASLNQAIFLATDLRRTIGLTQPQFEGQDQPLLCNVALPKGIIVNQNRDCDRIPTALFNRYRQQFKTVEAAKAYVNTMRQEKWD